MTVVARMIDASQEVSGERMTVMMTALRPWRNVEYEGSVAAGQSFSATESRARTLELAGLACRGIDNIVEFKSDGVQADGKIWGMKTCALRAPLVITIPAWGEHYVNYATRYVIPSVIAALKERDCKLQPKFLVYTDVKDRFARVLSGYDVEYMPVPHGGGHVSLIRAHKDVIMRSPAGSVMVLLNADIMVSREAFVVADLIFAAGYRAVASIGIRSLIKKEPPPVGASASDLLQWCWRNRHPIIEECVWGRGKSSTPTMIFFEQDENVIAHCVHLHPFMVVKDRDLQFIGTIDDDLLARYTEKEIYVLSDAEIGFAELSVAEKTVGPGNQSAPLSVHRVFGFGKNYLPSHFRNFRNALRITGRGPVDNTPAKMIADAWRR